MSIRGSLAQLLVKLATLGAILSFGALFSKYHLLFDLISHFRVQYIVLLIPGIVVAIAIRKQISLVILFTALAVHLYAVTVSWLPESISAKLATSTDYAEITVLSSNLLFINTEYDKQVEFIQSLKPDIVAFQEYTHAWDRELISRLTADYPHVVTAPANGAFGIALFSKYPITSGGVALLSPTAPQVIDAYITIEDREIRVMAVHPPPPVSQSTYEDRNETMLQIAKRTAAHDAAMIVMGDFNSTPWTAHFGELLSRGKLRNARAGHGLHPTWPVASLGFPFLIPIDHVLINKRVAAIQFGTQPLSGPDHRNIWSRLHIY